MSWRDNLQAAKFRNVPFEVTAHDLDTGRRGPVHEYPGRDKPMAEDLGRKAREFTIEAFVIGDDWQKKRDALIEACETFGPGKLVHPYLGSMQVENRGCRVSENSKEGRMARFSLVFVEAGENKFPASSVNAKASVRESSDNLKKAAAAVMEKNYSVTRRPAFVAKSAEDAIGGLLGSISKAGLSADALETISAAQKSLSTIVRSGGQVSSSISGVVSNIASGGNVPALSSLSQFSVATDLIPTTTPNRLQQIANLENIGTFVRASALAEEGYSLINSDFSSYQDAIKSGAQFSDKIANEILTPVVQNDNELFNAFKDIGTKVSTGLQLGARDLARLTTTSSPDPQPALVSAYELYEDATRDDEIIERNKIEHPSFLPPASDLEVLSV